MRHLTAQQLTAAADEQLVGVSLEVVRRHLGICPDCRTRLDRFTHQRDALRDALTADPGEDFWDLLYERVESRLHGLEPATRRGERVEPLRPVPRATPAAPAASEPPAAPALTTRASEPPKLRIVTVSTPEPAETREGSRAPLRGVMLATGAAALLVAAALTAVLLTPAPHTPAGTRLSFVPRVVRSIRQTAAAVVAPVAQLFRPRPPAAAPGPKPAAGPPADPATAPRLTRPAPEPQRVDLPVTVASPELPRTRPQVQRRSPAPLPAPRVKLPPPAASTPPAPVVAPPAAARPEPAPPAAPVTPPQSIAHAEPHWPLFCGQVRDVGGQPVAGARVQLADLDLGGRTDRNGRFCLAMPPGERTLSVSALGFATWRRIVDVAGNTTEIQVTLEDAR